MEPPCRTRLANTTRPVGYVNERAQWSGPRKRLTALGVIVLVVAVAYTGWTIWRQLAYDASYATVLKVNRHVTLSPERTVTYDATVQYVDAAGRTRTRTTDYRASWLHFEEGERVPILVNPRDATDFSFNTFVPTWGFCLLLFGAGGATLLVAKVL